MNSLQHNVWRYTCIGHVSYIRISAHILSTLYLCLPYNFEISKIYFPELYSVFGIQIHDELCFRARLLDFCMLFGRSSGF
jgi:hypothetical protein